MPVVVHNQALSEDTGNRPNTIRGRSSRDADTIVYDIRRSEDRRSLGQNDSVKYPDSPPLYANERGGTRPSRWYHSTGTFPDKPDIDQRMPIVVNLPSSSLVATGQRQRQPLGPYPNQIETYQLDGHQAVPGATSRLSSLGRKFVRISPLDSTACQIFMARHPEVADEDTSSYVAEAVAALRHGDALLAQSCLEKSIIISKYAQTGKVEPMDLGSTRNLAILKRELNAAMARTSEFVARTYNHGKTSQASSNDENLLSRRTRSSNTSFTPLLEPRSAWDSRSVNSRTIEPIVSLPSYYDPLSSEAGERSADSEQDQPIRGFNPKNRQIKSSVLRAADLPHPVYSTTRTQRERYKRSDSPLQIESHDFHGTNPSASDEDQPMSRENHPGFPSMIERIVNGSAFSSLLGQRQRDDGLQLLAAKEVAEQQRWHQQLLAEERHVQMERSIRERRRLEEHDRLLEERKILQDTIQAVNRNDTTETVTHGRAQGSSKPLIPNNDTTNSKSNGLTDTVAKARPDSEDVKSETITVDKNDKVDKTEDTLSTSSIVSDLSTDHPNFTGAQSEPKSIFIANEGEVDESIVPDRSHHILSEDATREEHSTVPAIDKGEDHDKAKCDELEHSAVSSLVPEMVVETPAADNSLTNSDEVSPPVSPDTTSNQPTCPERLSSENQDPGTVKNVHQSAIEVAITEEHTEFTVDQSSALAPEDDSLTIGQYDEDILHSMVTNRGRNWNNLRELQAFVEGVYILREDTKRRAEDVLARELQLTLNQDEVDREREMQRQRDRELREREERLALERDECSRAKQESGKGSAHTLIFQLSMALLMLFVLYSSQSCHH